MHEQYLLQADNIVTLINPTATIKLQYCKNWYFLINFIGKTLVHYDENKSENDSIYNIITQCLIVAEIKKIYLGTIFPISWGKIFLFEKKNRRFGQHFWRLWFQHEKYKKWRGIYRI